MAPGIKTTVTHPCTNRARLRFTSSHSSLQSVSYKKVYGQSIVVKQLYLSTFTFKNVKRYSKSIWHPVLKQRSPIHVLTGPDVA